MLLELTIQNIALIESLRIEFSRGFNVLTGETGAGKSIVVDSVNLALGGRADRDMIRTGAERAAVQALFDVTNCPQAAKAAEEMGADCEDGMLSVRRELSRSGRNICRLNGVIVPLGSMKGVTGCLMDVHGQHEHQALLDPARHLSFLDAYGDEAHRALQVCVRDRHEARRQTASRLKALLKDAAERERLTDTLSFQSAEILDAKLKPGEEERLVQRYAMLENAQKIRDGVALAYQLTYGAGSKPGAQEMLSRAAAAMEGISELDERFKALSQKLKDLYYLAQDAGYELQDILDNLEFDPAAAEKIGDRLDLIRRLERKYGATVADVIAFGDAAKARLDAIAGSAEAIDALKKELRARDQALKEACARLTDSRGALAASLAEAVVSQLRDLGMAKTRFEFRMTPLQKPTGEGADQVEMMISPNPGEPLKPLSGVASGGELSRVMLALKAVSMDQDGVETMVFDEIDTGISGRMAQVVGEKMRMIARNRQVLCVTHLPQIAALGQTHFLVEKTTDGQRTDSTVRLLDSDGRVRELSRLVGGAEDADSSLRHAENMLRAAQGNQAF